MFVESDGFNLKPLIMDFMPVKYSKMTILSLTMHPEMLEFPEPLLQV